MHDLIQQTGWAIIREEYPKDPSKWSRLWDPNDISNAFSAKKMKNIETISLDLSGSKEKQFTSKVFAKTKNMFAKMKKLRLLKVYYSDHYCLTRKKDKICLPIDFEFPPNLRYLHWEGLEFLPSNFHGKNLVAINLKSINAKELWTEDKCLANLKFIDVSDSQLVKIPKFSSMPNLERLDLGGCKSFYELHSSIDTFPKMEFLKVLNFRGSRIKELPSSIGSLRSLEILDLSQCTLFEKFPDIFAKMGHLRELILYGSGIKELPNSIGYLESLENLQLSHCSNFEKFPEIRGNMRCLRNLSLSSTPISELPDSIGRLGALEKLSLWDCSKLEKLPEFQRNMGRLIDLSAGGTAIKELPHSICHLTRLRNLNLSKSAIKELPSSICHLTGLDSLYLGKSAIEELPCSIGHLTQLHSIVLEDCKNFTILPSSVYKLKSLKSCSLNGCSNLEVSWEITEDMEHLECLYLRGMGIRELPSSIERLKGLTLLELSNCEILETLPDSIGHLTRLRSLLLHNCPKLHNLPDSLRGLQCCLQELDIGGCNMMEAAIPSDLWCLFSLLSLNVSESNIRCIPVGIIHLSQLNTLRMSHCPMLEEIPRLPSSLRRIEAHGCPHLETISSNPTHIFWSYLLNCFKSDIQDVAKRTYFRSGNIHLYLCYQTNVIIPESCGGIPEWVSHKNMGREIIINLPKNWYEDNNFLGFALFFHHIPLDDDDDICKTIYNCPHPHYSHQHVNIPQFSLWMAHEDKFKQVGVIPFERDCKSYTINGVGYCYISKDNKGSTSSTNPALRVAYYPQIVIASEYRSSRWNKFKVSFQGPFDCGDKTTFKVRSCGIHLIYDDIKDDAQDCPQQSPQPPSSFKRSHYDTEDHQQHKKSRRA